MFCHVTVLADAGLCLRSGNFLKVTYSPFKPRGINNGFKEFYSELYTTKSLATNADFTDSPTAKQVGGFCCSSPECFLKSPESFRFLK